MGAMDIKPQVEENLASRLEQTWQPGGGRLGSNKQPAAMAARSASSKLLI